MLILCLGIFLRIYSLSLLKNRDFWRIYPPKELVTRGIYKYIRHPAYLGGILILAGISFLCLGSFIKTIPLIWLQINFLLDRIDREEQMMLMVFGEEYKNYMDKTKIFIPYLF